MKILISAYSCEPGQGSERGVGWNVAREVAKYHEVWVLTRPDESKEAIEAELARNPVSNLHFVYFTLPFWKDSLRWGQSGAMQIHYYLWQIQAYFVARRLHRQVGFDIMHHVTFVKYSSPCFLALLSVPLVWGPVGGGESAPLSFWKDFNLRAKFYEIARSLTQLSGELDPFVRMTARRSAAVKATTADTAQRLYKMGVNHVEIESVCRLQQAEIDDLAGYALSPNSPVRFISIGRLLHWKGFHLGVRAFAAANLPDAEYWIVGEGGECDRLQQLAEELGVASRVKLWGGLPREQALQRLGECHVLVHPSLHDSGGGVCVEAMATGRPVICLDLGGPGVLVTKETGLKVSAHTPQQAIQDLAEAMRRLAHHPELRTSMGEAGRKLVRETYSWNAMGENLNQLYQDVADHTSA